MDASHEHDGFLYGSAFALCCLLAWIPEADLFFLEHLHTEITRELQVRRLADEVEAQLRSGVWRLDEDGVA